MKITTWNELTITEKLEIYDNYCTDFDGFGFFEAPMPFEEFDETFRHSPADAVRRLYKKSA